MVAVSPLLVMVLNGVTSRKKTNVPLKRMCDYYNANVPIVSDIYYIVYLIFDVLLYS
jgi:hypothetical protein